MTRWTPEMLAELSNLYHLARTAFAGRRDDAGNSMDTRQRRMSWAATEYERLHPEVPRTAAYKALDREVMF